VPTQRSPEFQLSDKIGMWDIPDMAKTNRIKPIRTVRVGEIEPAPKE
jgi:hypothetical protein